MTEVDRLLNLTGDGAVDFKVYQELFSDRQPEVIMEREKERWVRTIVRCNV